MFKLSGALFFAVLFSASLTSAQTTTIPCIDILPKYFVILSPRARLVYFAAEIPIRLSRARLRMSRACAHILM
ncbi:hypothetical protein Clacol_003408 [Clathrus columnatus]|uniref:Secreted protein n=1 Tax=Clathrus columnatus TaxID=1419009 RepID=A0AAV5A9G1_9AGAM|nr:hypothetical protein Clacol_003408 [Clathrus columnatus]